MYVHGFGFWPPHPPPAPLDSTVAEAYTTQPNSRASSRVLYMYFSCIGGMTVGTKRCTQTSSICGGPHACAVMPWGGDSYFMLGVGGCNYDASTGLPPGLEVGGLEV